MIILWIRKKRAEGQNVPDRKEKPSFREHDDIMKRFRLAHPDVDIVASKDIVTADGNLLAPIQKVKLAQHLQN
jgi:hypothetical protein